jgi:hypothetical protein
MLGLALWQFSPQACFVEIDPAEKRFIIWFDAVAAITPATLVSLAYSGRLYIEL